MKKPPLKKTCRREDCRKTFLVSARNYAVAEYCGSTCRNRAVRDRQREHDTVRGTRFDATALLQAMRGLSSNP